MPKRDDINKILIIGSGPIIIAQPESARAVLRLFHDHHGSQPS